MNLNTPEYWKDVDEYAPKVIERWHSVLAELDSQNSKEQPIKKESKVSKKIEVQVK